MENEYFQLRPEVPGGFGEGTRVDNSTFPPTINDLHLVFDGWLGDDLVACFPCYLVSVTLLNAMEEASLGGFLVGDVKVSYSEIFKDLFPDIVMPSFKQLIIKGKKGDDLYINENRRLVVSNRALQVLENNGNLKFCEINEEIG